MRLVIADFLLIPMSFPLRCFHWIGLIDPARRIQPLTRTHMRQVGHTHSHPQTDSLSITNPFTLVLSLSIRYI
ncbi:hypothetical protein B0T13DRAFT_467235, partial [Neurospora crassa]